MPALAVSSPLQSVPDGRSHEVAPWASAPFDPALAEEARRLIGRLDAGQRLWLSGYLAGSLGAAVAKAAPAAPAQPLVTILYGSHSGNGEQLAKRIGETLSSRGLSFVCLDMLDCRKNHLQEAQHLLVVVSTHGEGEPPDSAKPLYELLHSRKAPRLERVRYSVLALGDSSYAFYCETGRRFDAQLEQLGAQRLHDRVECDVDFQEAAGRWMDTVVESIAREHASSASIESLSPSAALAPASATIATAYTRKNPFQAEVLVNQRLTTRNSTKDVRHIELSIEGSGIHYEPGDALGVVPRNADEDVGAVLERLPFDAEAAVEVGSQPLALREALSQHFDIGLLTRPLLERYGAATQDAELVRLTSAGQEEDLQRYLRGRHLIDLLQDHPPTGLDVAAFAQTLRPLAPRLYSIASSLRATPGEVHLTVSHVAYQSHGRERHGVVSRSLALLTDEGATAPVYLQRNPAFHLPADPNAPILMIGPGTGVAPFRAFLAEREAQGLHGRTWLFFGDRSFWSDFLYQAEWLEWRKSGVLERIDVAFSRDAAQKVYVQQRIRERGREVYDWLENGAHVYVCGDAQAMAPDVERALLELIQEHRAVSAEQAEEYLMQLQRDRRYRKDVY